MIGSGRRSRPLFSGVFARLSSCLCWDVSVLSASVPLVSIAAGILGTGFLADLRVLHSVSINAAFFDAIRAKSPSSIVRDAASDLSLTTCAGVAESVEAWRTARGTSFELVDESSRVARTKKKSATRPTTTTTTTTTATPRHRDTAIQSRPQPRLAAPSTSTGSVDGATTRPKTRARSSATRMVEAKARDPDERAPDERRVTFAPGP